MSEREENQSLVTDYVLVYLGDNTTDIQVEKLVFRGDNRSPDEILRRGFRARGTSLNVIDHVDGVRSGFVSTSTSQSVASSFPTFPTSDKAFVYEIVRPSRGVDVAPAIREAGRTGELPLEDVDFYLRENEIAIPHRIRPGQIKGVWEVNIKTTINNPGTIFEKAVHIQAIDNNSYTPNPNFTPTRILSTARVIGRAVTAVGALTDGTRLYQSYQASQASNDFSPFFRDTAQVVSGWAGALALAPWGAQAGAAAGAFAGPIGVAVGAVVGGGLASVGGYFLGSQAGDALYQSRSNFSPIAQAQAATNQVFQSNIQHFGMHPFYSPYSSFSTTLFNTFNHSYPSWQSGKDSYTIRQAVESALRQEMGSSSPSVFSAWMTAQRALGMGVSLSYSEFTQVARMTNLVNSYNSYHPYANISDVLHFCKEIGGVATQVAVIEDLVNSPEQVWADDYYFCFPGTRLKPSLIHQVAQELKEGFYTHKTLPFFSLHFNNQGYLYPVIHPAYQQTLVGEVIAFLDYWMKGFLNGGVFDDAFIAQWSQTANCDETTLRAHLVDLKTYCKTHFSDNSYVSLRELMTRYGLDDKENSPSSAYKQPFMTSFRIISGQEKIERLGNLLVANPSIKVEYSIDLMPDYEQFIKDYQEQHGQYPEDYQKIRMCYERFAEEIKEKLPQLPFCRDFFDLLGVINFYCYFYTTLEKMGKMPLLESLVPERSYQVPKAFPPIPVRYYRRHDLDINLQEALIKIEQLLSEVTFNDTLGSLFKIRDLAQLPDILTATTKKAVIALIQEKLPQVEINDEEVAKISKNINRYILAYAHKHTRVLNRQLKPEMHRLSSEAQTSKTLSVMDKLLLLIDAIKTEHQQVLVRWDANPSSIEADSFRVFAKDAHTVLREKYAEIHQETAKILQAIDEAIKKLPSQEKEVIQKQTKELEQSFYAQANSLKAKKTAEIQELQGILAKMQGDLPAINAEIVRIRQHKDSEIAAVPAHLRAINQKQIDEFAAPLDAEITRLGQVKVGLQSNIIELSAVISEGKKALEKADIELSSQIQQGKESIIVSIKQATDELQKKYAEDKVKALNNRQEAIKSVATQLWSLICDEQLKELSTLKESILHFGTTLREAQALSQHRVASNYIYSVLSFSHNDISAESPHTRHVVGGCGMQLPNIKTETLADGEALAECISQRYSDEDISTVTIQWRDQEFTVTRLAVQDRPLLETQIETTPEATQQLEKLIKTEMLSAPVPSEILRSVMDNSGATWVHYASQVVSGNVFAALIVQDPSILSLYDTFGHAPIHCAIVARQADVLEAILRANPAQANVLTHTGFSPLMLAVQHGFEKGVALLLAHQANVEQVLPNGLYPLYLAVHNHYTDIAHSLINTVPSLELNRSLDNGMTPLHLAIMGNFEALALQLIGKGARGDIKRHSDGYTALHCAAEKGSLSILKALAASGYSLDMPLESGKTALHLAAVTGKMEVVRYLLTQNCNLSKLEYQGQTPLMLAIRAGVRLVAEYLAETTPVNLTNVNQETASVMAMKYGLASVADQLIQRGESVDLRDKEGKDYLYYLLKAGDYLRLEPLLTKNKSYLKQSYDGKSLLEVATHFKHSHVVGLLISLDYRYAKNHEETYATYLLSVDEVGAFRIAFNTLKPKSLEPWLQAAARAGSSRCLTFLLAKEPSRKWNFLQSAVSSRDLTTLGLAITKAPDLHASLDAKGNTALHLATALGDEAAVERLISSGSDVARKNKDGQTVFDIAHHQNDKGLHKRLMQWSRPSERPQSVKASLIKPSSSKVNYTLKEASGLPVESLSQLQDFLEIGNLDAALALLEEKPTLLNAFKTIKGPKLFQQVLDHLLPLHLIDDAEEQDTTLSKILLLLKSAGIHPALYTKQHNLLLNLLNIDDEQAVYRLEQLFHFFPESIAILLREELSRGMTFSQLVLIRGKIDLFDKLCTFKDRDDVQLLNAAILAGQMSFVKKLYHKGKNHLTQKRQTPLMVAASTGNTFIVELLLSLGESVDAADLQGRTALHHAILADAEQVALMLLPHLKRLHCADRQGVTPLALASAKGMLSVVRHICDTEGVVLNYDKNGHHALHQAALYGQADVIEVLAHYGYPLDAPEKPAKPSKLLRCQKRTALHLAVLRGHIKAVDRLMSLGADASLPDAEGQAVGDYAIMSRSQAMSAFIKAKVSEGLKHDHQKSMLFAAAKTNQLAFIDEAIIGGDSLNCLNAKDQNLLHVCAIHGSLEVAKRLLLAGNLLLDAPDSFGKTPLDYAVAVGHVAIIRCFMEAGVSKAESATSKGSSMALKRYGFYQSAPIEIDVAEQEDFKLC